VQIGVSGARLEGQLAIPPRAIGLVVFVHGSGSSRHSPRNRLVARTIRDEANAATLLVDLLGDAERAADDRTVAFRFDVELLERRVSEICDWAELEPRTRALPLGLFGSNTGAAAALASAAEHPNRVAAVVTRGGRPDLAGAGTLAAVRAPTLLVVGSEDPIVLDVNRAARRVMTKTTCHLEVVLGASHLFEEPGTLNEAARLAAAWFARYLPNRSWTTR